MAGVAGLNWIAMNLFELAEVESLDPIAFERLNQAYLFSAGDNGEIGYGFRAWNHAIIEVTGDSRNVLEGARGIGYYIQTGMEGIEDFNVVWPTREDPRFRPIDWIRDEADRVIVYMQNTNQLMLVRDMSRREPTGPLNHNGRRTGHIFRSGCGALGYAIGSANHEGWEHMARHLGDSCANSPNALLDGHASTLLHTLWGSLGAARSNEAGFRHYMEGIRWWFVMAQTHDGSFVAMPGRDYASTDHVYAGRNFPTATAALILSVKEAQLQITGANAPHIVRQQGVEEEEAEDERPGRRPSTRTGPDLTPFGNDFTITHCTREAELLGSSAPYSRVLSALDAAAVNNDEHGTEAAEFAAQLRAWIAEQNSEIIEGALTQPAQTLASTRDYMRRLSGIDDYGSAGARRILERIGEDSDTRTLARYYEQLDRILALEAERGATDETTRGKQQLAQQIQRFIQTPGLGFRLMGDARELLSEVQSALPSPVE